MLEGGGKVSDYLKPEDLAGISRDELVNLCREAIEGNPAAVNDIASGKLKAMGSLFGYIKRASGGKADIKECEKIIRELLKI